jgi:hypothetical protein
VKNYKELGKILFCNLYTAKIWPQNPPTSLVHEAKNTHEQRKKKKKTHRRSRTAVGSRLLPTAVQHDVLGERRRSRPLGPRLLLGPPVQIPHQRQSRELEQRRQDPRQQEDHDVRRDQRDDQVGPVRHARAVARERNPGAPRPHDEAVGEVDGEDHGVEEDEEAHREEGLDPARQLDGDLQADGEEQDGEGGFLVAGVVGAGFGGHYGFPSELVGVDVLLGDVEGPFLVEDAEEGRAKGAG